MTFIGDLERAFASFIFPNLVPLTILFVVGLIGLALLARRRGWDGVVRRHRRGSVILVAALLAVGIPVGAYLTSPLFTRTELVEAAPGPATAAADASPSPIVSAPPTIAPAPTLAPSPGIGAPTRSPASSPASAATADSSASPAPSSRPAPSPTAPPSPAAAPSATIGFPVTRANGKFVGADGFHFGRGRALVIETAPGRFVVRFEAFSVRNGPDLHVFLSPDPDGYAKGAVELGLLKATDGAFNYQVPASIDVESAKSVVVWCLTFGVQFAHAELSAD
jgi:hypothetical protein